MEEKNQEFYQFLSRLWRFIKHTEIPANNDNEAWDEVVDKATLLTSEYKTSDPRDKLFRTWVIAYLDYMSAISKGVPTLMQECNEVKKAV